MNAIEEVAVYELTTTLRLESASREASEAFVDALSKAVFEATGEHPAVTAYFVTLRGGGDAIDVGLRFEGVPPDVLDEWADDILTEALDNVHNSGGQQEKTAVLASQLVMA